MRSRVRRLPSLTALSCFEAAGRLMSFTLAAEELHLTQGAVSRQIRLLEDSIGVLLFVRHHRAVVLTDSGRRYHRSVSLALSQLGSATTAIAEHEPVNRLSIAATGAVARFWLLPRLGELSARLGDSDIRLFVTDDELDLHRGRFDVGIRYGPGRWPGEDSLFVAPGVVVPVCAPGYLAGRPALSPQALSQERLLHLEDQRWQWVDWQVWFSEFAVHNPASASALRVNQFPLLMDAARNGLGVALGWQHLIDDLIERGELVRACEATMETGYGFYAVAPQSESRSVLVDVALQWIVEQFAARPD